MLDELLHISALFDLYGALLTERQQTCLRLHLFEDFSLSEIGDELGVSRQAVHDILHRSEQILASYESKLGFLAKQQKERAALTDIYNEFAALPESENARVKQVLAKLVVFTEID